MYKVPSKRDYEIGDILIFKGESNRFKTGKYYRIIQKTIIDYSIDGLDSAYGNEVLYFEGSDFGCYAVFADDNFVPVDEYRDKIINKILND